MRRRPSPFALAVLTPPIVLPTHYLAVLPHEFAHRFMAWGLGHLSDPVAIDWGGASLANLLLLVNIDEGVDYDAVRATGPAWHVALIAVAGPGLANGALLALSRLGLDRAARSGTRPLAYYALYWFWLMNLANIYDYVPMRTFATHADVRHFLDGTGLSPWTVYVLGGYVVAALIVGMLRTVLPLTYRTLDLPLAQRSALLITSAAILFGYFALPGFFAGDPMSLLLAGTSVAAIPAIVFVCWPDRPWVEGRMART